MLRKRNKIEAGLFGFQQVVPIRTYFLYHNLKKKPYEKTCFHSLKLGCTIFSWAIFLVRNRQSSETRFFSRILVGHHFEFWDRPKRKLESADVAESDKNVDGAKKDDIFGSVISVWQRKNWKRWGPHKVAGRCRLRKCPDTLGVYSCCLIWLERVSIIWFDVIVGIVWLYNQQQTVSKSPWSSLASDFRIHIWKIHADTFFGSSTPLYI